MPLHKAMCLKHLDDLQEEEQAANNILAAKIKSLEATVQKLAMSMMAGDNGN